MDLQDADLPLLVKLISEITGKHLIHDGAVIVRKNRVAAAAGPRAPDPLLSTQLGPRHRAGIGVTEESDAVAVVVSEQTGAIALMSGGTVELNLTPEQLRDRLRRVRRQRAARPPGSGP